ncbi:N-acetyltransferase family protein [Streptomyces sp. URMC 125]|uniref:GNAT family N-acetyltransferase n=1 Tax=Streptomyces sp. URMC 125 TaxID=3423419 RepID=UPI003F1B66E4
MGTGSNHDALGADGPVVRRATGRDAPAVAGVRLRSFAAALPGVRRARTDRQVAEWIRETAVPHRETWVAAVRGEVVGMMVLGGGGELEQLHLDPAWRGRGAGDRLVGLAKRRRPDGLVLWTFQANGPARRFYERHGSCGTGRTDGARNEEREPDIRYEWRPGGR